MKRGGQPHFLPRSPEIWICGRENGKKVYEKKGKQRCFVPLSSQSHDAPKYGFGDG